MQIQIQISLLFLKNITFLSEEITINCSAVHKDWRKGEDTHAYKYKIQSSYIYKTVVTIQIYHHWYKLKYLLVLVAS
jgi:hypothetical protein